MAYTPLEMISGINPNTSFLLDLDTKKRMANVFEDVKEPMQYQVPTIEMPDPLEGLSQPQIFAEGNKGTTIVDAVNSGDPALRKLALNKILNGTATNALEAGVGDVKITPYYKWQDKFLNDEFGLNPNLSQAQNEQYYYQNQYDIKTNAGKLISNVGKFIGRTVPSAALKLGEGFGYIGAMAYAGFENLADAITGQDNHNFMATVSENAFSRRLSEMEEGLKNSSLLSVYKPVDWEQKGFFDKMSYGALWTDEFADGVAFLASAAVPAMVIGKLGKGISLLSKNAKAWNASMRFLGTESLGDVGSVIYNTTMESAVEAAEGFKQYKQDLKDKRNQKKEGFENLSDDEIDRMAGEVAADRFKANMGILAVSNLFENKFIFKPLANRLARATTGSTTRAGAHAILDEAGEAIETKAAKTWFGRFMGSREGKFNPLARVPFYGKRFLKASVMEGLWEENAQLAAERWAASSTYQNAFGDQVNAEKQLWKQYLNQTEATFKGEDRENETSIGLGALIGIFGTGVVAKAFGGTNPDGSMNFFGGERKTQIANAKAGIQRYNEAYRNMLSLSDIHNTDDKGNKTINAEKVAAKAKALQDFGFQQITTEQIKDPVFRKKLQQDLFAHYIAAAVQADLHEGLIGRLDNMNKISKEKLQSLGLNTEDVFGDPLKYAERGKELIREYKNIENTNSFKPASLSFQEHSRKEQDRKYFSYMAYARMKSSEDAEREYGDQVLTDEAEIKNVFSATSDMYPFHLDKITRYNRLAIEREALNQSIDEFEFFGHSSMVKMAKERIKEIDREKKQIKDDLNALPEAQDRIKEVGETENTMLEDTKINSIVRVMNNSLLENASKQAQLFIDIKRNKVLHERLKDPSTGLDAYEEYLEYLAKRKVTEQEADANPNLEIVKEETEALKEREKGITEVQKMEDDGTMTNDELEKEKEALATTIAKNNAIANPPKPPVDPAVERKMDSTIDEMERRRAEAMAGITPDAANPGYFSTLIEDENGKLSSIVAPSEQDLVNMINAEVDKALDSVEEIISTSRINPATTTFSNDIESATSFFQTGDNTDNVLSEYDEESAHKYESPLSTINKAANVILNPKNPDEIIYDVEEMNPNSYTAALDASIRKGVNRDLYEPVVMLDREEWLNRLSPEDRAKTLEEGVGIVLVFRNKKDGSFLSVGQQITGPRFKAHKDKIIAHAIDDVNKENTGFNVHKDLRAQIKSARRRMTLPEVYASYQADEKVSNFIRTQLLMGKDSEILVDAVPFGTGIVPLADDTFVVERFRAYSPKFVLITKENIDSYPGATEGKMYVTFPGKVDRNSEAKFFQVNAPSIFGITTVDSTSPEDQALAKRIELYVQDVISGRTTFETKEEAIEIIQRFLEKIIYTKKGTAQLDIVKTSKGAYVIEYVSINKEGERKTLRNTANIKLNVNNRIYLGLENLPVPDENGILVEITNKQYVDFIEARLKTNRKVLKTKDNKLHLDPINAYYNLEYLKSVPAETKEGEEKVEETLSSEEEKTESSSLPNNIYIIGSMQIDLEALSSTYVGSPKPEAKAKATEEFLSKAAELQAKDDNVVFGERENNKKQKIYFFGNKKIGTFVLFDNKLNQIKREEKFSKENPELYQEIQNQCK